jgi:hypothetical protein
MTFHPLRCHLLAVLIQAHRRDESILENLHRMTASLTALQRVEFLQNLLSLIRTILSSFLRHEEIPRFSPRDIPALEMICTQMQVFLQLITIDILLEEVEDLDPEWEKKITPEEREILKTFSCPITHELFRDPITLVQSGMNYQRRALQSHFKTGRTTCPLTGTEIPRSTIQSILQSRNHKTNVLIRNETLRHVTRIRDRLLSLRHRRLQQLGATQEQIELLRDVSLEDLEEELRKARRQKRALAAQKRRLDENGK